MGWFHWYYILFVIIWAIIWGFATDAVLYYVKGYGNKTWFWWGFFFGIIPFIVAFTIPYNPELESTGDDAEQRWFISDEDRYKIIAEGGWNCNCGRWNQYYIGTCACGRTRETQDDLFDEQSETDLNAAEAERIISSNHIQQIKALKELFDSGAITQDEFETKKGQLL